LARFCAGKDEAATELYHRYVERLRRLVEAQFSARLAARLDADDILQSAFGSFFRAAKTGIYHVPAGEHLWKLLLTITLNKIRSQGTFHNAAKRDVRLTIPLEEAEPAKSDDVAEAHFHLVLDEALARLPPLHRQMVELRLRGYEVADIAQQTGRAKRTAERVLQQALAQLTSLFEKEE
jgi:RNA polymerase sigma-70 factor (ECF subfamily)